MLYSTPAIFQNARYLYSTQDYEGDPNVYRWNYFYTPVQIGENTVGVRIAVRDVVQSERHTGENQIYNWGIKKGASLDGVQPVVTNSSHGASSDVPTSSISKNEPIVKPVGEPTIGMNNERAVEGARPYNGGGGSVPMSEAQVLERALQLTAQGKTVANSTDVDGIIAELGDDVALRRLYNAEQAWKPTGTINIEGRVVDAAAYVDAYEQSLPDSADALQEHIRQLNEERVAEIIQMEQEGTLEEYTPGGLKIDLQLFAAKRKWDLLQIAPAEGGKKASRFYENRVKGKDELHTEELREMLAGRDESYNPIGNQKTLDRANQKLRDPKYQAKLLKRLSNDSKHNLLNEVDLAAAQVLVKDAINEGNYDVAMDLDSAISRAGTRLGRAVQSLSIISRMTPEGTLRFAQKTLKAEADYVIGEGANEGLDILADDIADKVNRLARLKLGGGQTSSHGDAHPYGQGSDQAILDMLGKIRSGEFNQNDKVEFGKVPESIAQQLKEITGADVTGYKMVIEARILDHILKGHGVYGDANKSLANDADVARMGDVLANPDEIRQVDPTKSYVHHKDGKMKPSPTVLYEKGEGDLSYYVIHTITDTKKKMLYVVTAFRGQPGYKKGAQQSSDGNTPGDTAKPELAGTPASIVPQSGGQVKAEIGMSREELVNALAEDLATEPRTYLTKEEIYDALWNVVEESTNIPEQVKRPLFARCDHHVFPLVCGGTPLHQGGNLSAFRF